MICDQLVIFIFLILVETLIKLNPCAHELTEHQTVEIDHDNV